MNEQNKVPMLTAHDIKKSMGIALGAVYRLMRRPDFPAIKVSARRYVVPEDAFRRWLDEQAEAKKTGADAEWHP